MTGFLGASLVTRADANPKHEEKAEIFAFVKYGYLWTPKPWKMKVLNPQYMGYNP